MWVASRTSVLVVGREYGAGPVTSAIIDLRNGWAGNGSGCSFILRAFSLERYPREPAAFDSLHPTTSIADDGNFRCSGMTR
jgi:hypothetical protein